MRTPLFVILLAALFLTTSCTGLSSQGPYGEVVHYSQFTTVEYPDFNVQYVDRRREVTEQYPRGFVYYDFEISTEDETVQVSWTPGTGAVAPHLFSIGGDEYFLVLQINELDRENPMLGENEMIIWPKETYLEKQKQNR